MAATFNRLLFGIRHGLPMNLVTEDGYNVLRQGILKNGEMSSLVQVAKDREIFTTLSASEIFAFPRMSDAGPRRQQCRSLWSSKSFNQVMGP